MRHELKTKDRLKITGWVKLLANGKVVAESHNLITTVGKALVGDMLIDVSGYDTGLTYCAIGTGTTTPTVANTTLVTETARTTITYKERSSNTLFLQTLFLAANCNVFIKEVGLFGHSTASGAANSGVLFARALLSYDNSGGSPVDLTLQWRITLGS